jgi:hypothetical protein
MPDMQDGYVFLSLRCHLNFARMIIKTITPNSELERKNHQELSVIANELSIWHYRVQSALLVASSALLALSSAPIPASSNNHRILLHLYYTGLLCNVLQLLASSIVLGILLSNHSRFVRKASKELLKTNPRESTIVFSMRKSIRYLFRFALVASFVFFVATISIVALCRIFAS